MSPELLRAIVTILFGALAGGLTNTVAVWMLFHPYDPPRLGRTPIRFLHGAIPKNRERLARAIGRAVGDGLLTPDDLTRILSSEEFRREFDHRLARVFQDLLERERGPIRGILPSDVVEEAQGLLEEVADLLASRLTAWLDSPAFEDFVQRRVREVLDGLSGTPASDLLTHDRRSAVAHWLERWASDVIDGEGTRRAVEAYVDSAIEGLRREHRTLEDILPSGLIDFIAQSVPGALPPVAARVAEILDDPHSRRRVERAVHELSQRVMQDLRFHQRLVARLVVTEESLEQLIATMETEGVAYFSEVLKDPAVQEAMVGKVRDALLDALQRPVGSVFEAMDSARVQRIRETLVDWILGVARHPDTREFLSHSLRQGLDKAADRQWDELLTRISPEQITHVIVAAARSDPGRRAYDEAIRKTFGGALDRPMGRPANWLPLGFAERLRSTLSDPVWDWVQNQIPPMVATLDVGRRVEEKVLEYPTWKMEELVRDVTQRELRLIIRLGYFLGAIIGGILVTINTLVT